MSDYDVVFVGAGVAAAVAGARLAAAGASVVFLEAGPRTERDAAVTRLRGGLYPYESPAWAPQPTQNDPDHYYVQAGKVKFSSDYERRVGGTTWHWLGTCPRLLPSDFELQTRFGVGVDWPIGYDDLEPWYVQAEHELGVAGDSDEDAGSPRSAPFPMPAIPIASGDHVIRDAAAKHGIAVVANPQARNSVDGFQGRPQCCGNATCIPICPIQAKYDATYHIDLAEHAGATVVENAVVFQVDVGDDGKVSGVHYTTPDNDDVTVTGTIYVIAANAIETPKLLLMSKNEAMPNGVANSSDQVGRNLCDHPWALASAVADFPYAGSRGPNSVAGGDNIRAAETRGEFATYRFEVGHFVGNPQTVADGLIGKGLVGKQLYEAVRRTAPYQMLVAALLEQLPDPENRIVPDWDHLDEIDLPRPKIIYSHGDYTLNGWEQAKPLFRQILEDAGGTEVTYSGPSGAGHLLATHRMGDDPATSVTDSYGRTHDHPNLFLAGGGLFPTVGTANPTLTIVALALRSAELIGSELGYTVQATPVASPIATPAG
ncbi:MAG TPA: GMC family oxidoreductase [Thermomicrobiales bacterium]|nr:GMC family oxidoreductase [Thermomicrobiales bacterium]